MHETEAGPKGGEKGVDRAVEAARATVDQVSLRAKTARKVGDRAAALLNANAVSKEESETRLSTETAAKVRFTELPGRVFTAKLARTSRTFDTSSSTMRAEFLIANEELLLPAGLTVFSLPPAPATFIVPANTLILRQGNALVAVVKDGKVSYVDVLPGKNSGVTIEVTSAA